MRKLLYIVCLLAAGAASAQQLPERRAVRSGNRLYNRGDYAASIARYEQALAADPASFEATYDLGNALCKAEMYDQAEERLARAVADTLRTENERAEAYYNLGNAQFRQQKYREALASYRQSLRLNPSDMEAKYNYAYTKRLLDQNQDQNQNQNQNQDQNQDRNGGDNQQQNQNQDQNNNDQNQNNDDQNKEDNRNQEQNDPQQNPSDKPDDPKQGEGEGRQQPAGLSEQEQQQILDAIQAQEDKTQDKLKEKRGVVVRSKKNW